MLMGRGTESMESLAPAPPRRSAPSHSIAPQVQSSQSSARVSPAERSPLPSGTLLLSLHDMLSEEPPRSLSAASAGRGSSSPPTLADAKDDSAALAAAGRKLFQPYHAQSVPREADLQATASADTGQAITTMMLRNIPNKYAQTTLLQEIDTLGFVGTYNFFYLPMDVHNRSNVGYSFINFERPEDAEWFRNCFSEHRFQRFHSRKIGSVCRAHVQGLDENLRHFENRAVTQARNDQYRPVVLKASAATAAATPSSEGAVGSTAVPIAGVGASGSASSTCAEKGKVGKQQAKENHAAKAKARFLAAAGPAGQKKTGGVQEEVSWPQRSAAAPQAAAAAAAAGGAPGVARLGLEAAIFDLLQTNKAVKCAGPDVNVSQPAEMENLLLDQLIHQSERNGAPHGFNAGTMTQQKPALPGWGSPSPPSLLRATNREPAYVNLDFNAVFPVKPYAEKVSSWDREEKSLRSHEFETKDATPRTNRSHLGASLSFPLHHVDDASLWKNM